MLNIIKNLLQNIIDDINAGNCNISEQDEDKIISCLKLFVDNDVKYSKYMACKFLNISRAAFDNYVRAGKIPKGTREIGFKELSWSKKDLINSIKNIKEHRRK